MLLLGFHFPDTLLSPITSALALALAVYVFLKGRSDAKTSATLQYKAQVRQWAETAIAGVSEAMFLIRLDPTKNTDAFFAKRHERCYDPADFA
jgi:uncharacterized membrane protein YfcA